MPFRFFDAPLWRLMGVGIDWMVAVAVVGGKTCQGRCRPRFRPYGVGAVAARHRRVGRRLPAEEAPLRFAGAGFVVAGCAVAMMAARARR